MLILVYLCLFEFIDLLRFSCGCVLVFAFKVGLCCLLAGLG